ncbi:AbrB/MazE/SpoVT family DNA-binding domain-containing protein [Bacillota bacterium Lsc_1132]
MLLKRLNKKGQISIPKKIQQQLKIKDGDSLTIFQQKEQIILKSRHPNKRLNQCILSGGRISIPAELRRILNIHIDSDLEMEVSVPMK